MASEYKPGSLNEDMPDDESAESPDTPASGSVKRVCCAVLPDGSLWVYEEPVTPPAEIPQEQVFDDKAEAMRAVWQKIKSLSAGETDDALMHEGFNANMPGRAM